MATTVVLTDAYIRESDGHIIIQWNDGTETELSNLASLQYWAQLPDTDVELTKQMCVAYLLFRQPDLGNIQVVKDKDFTFDLSAASVVRII